MAEKVAIHRREELSLGTADVGSESVPVCGNVYSRIGRCEPGEMGTCAIKGNFLSR